MTPLLISFSASDNVFTLAYYDRYRALAERLFILQCLIENPYVGAGQYVKRASDFFYLK